MATAIEKDKDPKYLLSEIDEFRKIAFSNLTKVYTEYRLRLLALHESGLKLAEQMNQLSEKLSGNFYATEFAVRAIDIDSIEKARRIYTDKTWDNTVLPLTRLTEEKQLVNDVTNLEKKIKNSSTQIQNQIKKEKQETTKRLRKEKDTQVINMINSETEKRTGALLLQQRSLAAYWRNFRDKQIYHILQLVTEGLSAELDFYKSAHGTYQDQSWLSVTTVPPIDWPEPNFTGVTIFEGISEESLAQLTTAPVRNPNAAPSPLSSVASTSGFSTFREVPSKPSLTSKPTLKSVKPTIPLQNVANNASNNVSTNSSQTNYSSPNSANNNNTGNSNSENTSIAQGLAQFVTPTQTQTPATENIPAAPPRAPVGEKVTSPSVTPTKKEEGVGPEWEEFKTEEGQKYYFNKRENRSTWTPKMLKEQAKLHGKPTGISKWVQHLTEEGLPYWYNEETDESVWEKPQE